MAHRSPTSPTEPIPNDHEIVVPPQKKHHHESSSDDENIANGVRNRAKSTITPEMRAMTGGRVPTLGPVSCSEPVPNRIQPLSNDKASRTLSKIKRVSFKIDEDEPTESSDTLESSPKNKAFELLGINDTMIHHQQQQSISHYSNSPASSPMHKSKAMKLLGIQDEHKQTQTHLSKLKLAPNQRSKSSRSRNILTRSKRSFSNVSKTKSKSKQSSYINMDDEESPVPPTTPPPPPVTVPHPLAPTMRQKSMESIEEAFATLKLAWTSTSNNSNKYNKLKDNKHIKSPDELNQVILNDDIVTADYKEKDDDGFVIGIDYDNELHDDVQIVTENEMGHGIDKDIQNDKLDENLNDEIKKNEEENDENKLNEEEEEQNFDDAIHSFDILSKYGFVCRQNLNSVKELKRHHQLQQSSNLMTVNMERSTTGSTNYVYPPFSTKELININKNKRQKKHVSFNV